MQNASPHKLWKLGNHRLLLGDARNAEDVSRIVGSEKATLLLTDPPYGVGFVEGSQAFLRGINKTDKTKNFAVIKGDGTEEDYYAFSRAWLEAVRPHLTDKNAFYIFSGDSKLRELLNALHDTRYTKSSLLIWLKNHAVMGRRDYNPQHELVVYGWHGTHAFFGNKDKTMLFYRKPNRNRLHPTMKPPALLRRLLYHSTKPNDVVLDPFAGSGSTLIACEQLGRRCLAIEYEEAYCNTVVDRWEKLTKQKAELVTNA